MIGTTVQIWSKFIVTNAQITRCNRINNITPNADHDVYCQRKFLSEKAVVFE